MRLTKYSLSRQEAQSQSIIPRYMIYCRKSSESDERQIQSLPDQITNLTDLVKQKGLELIGEPLQESKTAKIPGRPIFNKVIQMIEDGKINGIVLLNPSRLSRNTVDTGRVIYLMDQGKLLEVITPYQTFRNNPNDKFMLNLLCTQAKLENDNKSVNIKESLKLKAERGVFPGKARPGYKNNHEKPQGLRDISRDNVYFPIMRKLFDLALTGNYSVAQLVREAKDLGLRSSVSGKPLVKSRMYTLLRDPFYTGRFIYKGKLYQGQHPAMITDSEYNLLQDVLDGKSRGRQQKHDFALNGVIKCGECHYTITAQEHKKNYKNGTSQIFTYYNCTKKGSHRCHQPYAPTSKVEGDFASELTLFELDQEFVDLAYEALDQVKDQDQTVNKNSFEALETALEGINRRMDNLITLKISPENSDGSLLSNTEFADRKRALMIEKDKITQQLNQAEPTKNEWANITRDAFDFALLAYKKFTKGKPEVKKEIFKTIGLNPILLDRKLQYQLRFIFMKIKKGIEETKRQMRPLEPAIVPSQQSNLKNFVKNSLWCRGEELNLQVRLGTQGPKPCASASSATPATVYILYHRSLIYLTNNRISNILKLSILKVTYSFMPKRKASKRTRSVSRKSEPSEIIKLGAVVVVVAAIVLVAYAVKWFLP